jgi:hypothetical protein
MWFIINGKHVARILSLISKVKLNSKIEHEATTSKIGEDQVFYCNQRGIQLKKPLL